MELRLGLLYPSLMSLYGDRGNAMILARRAERRGIAVTLSSIEPGSRPRYGLLDLTVGGGGQDREQRLIQPDLLRHGRELIAAVHDGLPLLAVCGTYQLLGHYYQTAGGERLAGLGLFDLVTVAEPGRLVGNIALRASLPGLARPTLAGFENHAGRTYLGETAPLGTVLHGHGNNGLDGGEGAVHLNCLGTYLHGPVLALNPHLADYLLDLALARRYGTCPLPPPEEGDLEVEAHLAALARF
ncbi:MAG: type 1 glutamine amidotransferase [Patescibacteria group bacterium]